MPVNGDDNTSNYKPPHNLRHHIDNDDDDDDGSSAGDAVGNDVTVAPSVDMMPTVDSSVSAADCSSNGASKLLAGDINGASTLSAGDSVSSDGSFNGFVVAMHRKMVLRHISSSVNYTLAITDNFCVCSLVACAFTAFILIHFYMVGHN